MLEWWGEERKTVPRESLTQKLVFEQRSEGDEEEYFLIEGTAGAKALSGKCLAY